MSHSAMENISHIDPKKSQESIMEQVRSVKWMHSIDLGNGITTPGEWRRQTKGIWDALEQIDFYGKKVLDIGCWDGLWSFEAERRGAAQVYATDLLSQRHLQETPAFRVAHRILNSKVIYDPNMSVFDVAKLKITDFDVVLFCGIYYHLKEPLLALAKLRTVMKEGAKIIVEGEVHNNLEKPMASFFYRERYVPQDPSNWWVPNIRCLKEWGECCFFDVESEFGEKPLPDQTAYRKVRRYLRRSLGREEPVHTSRYTLLAKAVRRKDNGYAFPDPDLHPFIIEPKYAK
jgi:tRNA (mo5U34)-methyltransferase